MNARRVSSPPQLPGFEFIELIGSGGYADVFLYQQAAPRRQVAVKILDSVGLDGRAATDYTEEANVMAMVSAHPHIVQVFQASVSPDGRPFLVMEYYPNQNFQERARTEQMSVAEVLRVGIQIASAVETAHHAGILHRDIKPANILTSEFNHPGLTDFGIAAVAGRSELSGDGLSIPWSPPEALGEAPTLVQSDVYSLAATIYTMLAGRAPFEITGGDNRPLAMMARIERDAVPSVGRADVPRLLERVLAGAMSKDPGGRPNTAADFARQLQEVESSMQLPVTPLQLRDNGPIVRSRVTDRIDDDATRVKGVTSVDAQPVAQPVVDFTVERSATIATRSPRPAAPARPGPTSTRPAEPAPARPQAPVAPVASSARSREGLLPEPEVSDTLRRSQTGGESPAEYQPPTKIPRLWFGIGAAAALIVVVVLLTQLLGGGSNAKSTGFDETAAEIAEVNDNLDTAGQDDVAGPPAEVAPLPVPRVRGKVVAEDSHQFTWKNPGQGVSFYVRVDGQAQGTQVDTNEFVTDAECIEVEVVAPSGMVSAPTRGCVP